MTFNVYFHRANGWWGWKKDYTAPSPTSIDDVDVTLIQNGIRILNLQTDSDEPFKEVSSIALNIINLIQLCEGYFHCIDSVEYIASDGQIEHKSIDELKKEGLIDFYKTHRNFIRGKFELVPPSEVITANNYKSWMDLYKKLLGQYRAFLYYCIDNEFPIDLRMANFIQLCEPIAEYDTSCVLSGDCTLKNCLRQLVINYGQLVFKREFDAGIFDFDNKTHNGNSSILQKLVNTRVNLLHYKLKPKECFNSGAEMAIYCDKIYLLYRIAFLNLIGIDICDNKIKTATEYIETGMVIDYDFSTFISSY
jgi:hypothetical protein